MCCGKGMKDDSDGFFSVTSSEEEDNPTKKGLDDPGPLESTLYNISGWIEAR